MLERLGKSGDANGIERPPDGAPTPPLRERAPRPPTTESCDLLSPLGKAAARVPLTSAAAGELDSLFLRSPEPPLLLVLAASGDDWFGVSVTFSMTLASGKPPFASVKPPHWLFWVGYLQKNN